jgi:hypothetical protein
MPAFIICSRDVGLPLDDDKRRVDAPDANLALDRYVQKVIVPHPLFRNWVLSPSVNDGLLETFYLRDTDELQHFQETGEVIASDETVRQRILEYFGAHKDYAQAYLAYLQDENPSHITEAMFEYLAHRYGHAAVAVDLDSIPWLPA